MTKIRHGYEAQGYEAEAFVKSRSWSRNRSFHFLKSQSRSRSFSLKSFGFVKPKPKAEAASYPSLAKIFRVSGVVHLGTHTSALKCTKSTVDSFESLIIGWLFLRNNIHLLLSIPLAPKDFSAKCSYFGTDLEEISWNFQAFMMSRLLKEG